MFEGVHTALVTPFLNGKLDEPALVRLIESQIAGGVAGIAPVGTTGESPTLDYQEHERVITLAVQTAARRCKVLAGTGSNSTAEAIALTKEAQKAGADAAFLAAPYYNRPSQEGLFRHFKAVAEAVPELPILPYNIPGRCGVEIGIDCMRRLVEACPNIAGIKEAGGSVDRVSQLRQALPASFEILSGDDALTLPFMSAGAVGVISVVSNIIPAELVQLVKAAREGRYAEALALHEKLYPLFRDCFVETNPVPVKTALAWQGRIGPELRLPLCEMSEANALKLQVTLQSLQLL